MKAKSASADDAKRAIEKSLLLKGLTLEDTANLLQCNDKKIIELMFAAAKRIKEEIYGNRIVLFAPLYVTNICQNNCLYCGFRRENKELVRRKLSMDEIANEVKHLVSQGHKRVLLLTGEDTKTASIEYVTQAIKTVYDTKAGRGEIRRVNVNIAPLTVPEFRKLKEAGIGTYQLFQETYHRETYRKMHPSGPKADYEWRLSVMDRAMEAGIDDVGIGALFGLYDCRFEVLALLQHCQHLERKFGFGPHTISVPRIRTALNTPLAKNIPYPMTDDEFKKVVAIIRMAVPYTGMILSTRENASLRDELLSLGISQISAGSRTNPGAYSEDKEHSPESEQFSVTDTRTQAQVIHDVLRKGMLPSFCTSCYRSGRTGEAFMEFAKHGEIHKFCHPNAILTFKEYLLDYADDALRAEGEKAIKMELQKIEPGLRAKTEIMLARMDEGKRDERI